MKFVMISAKKNAGKHFFTIYKANFVNSLYTNIDKRKVVKKLYVKGGILGKPNEQ